MAIKKYAIINPNTSLVLFPTTHEESTVVDDYAGFGVQEIPEDAPGVRSIVAGMLFHAGKFWLDAMSLATPANMLRLSAWRGRFTPEELVRIDNYASDTALTPMQKTEFKTFLMDVEGQTFVNLETPTTAQYVDFLVGIQYLDASRKDALLGVA